MENKELVKTENKIDVWVEKLNASIPANIKVSFPEEKVQEVVAGFLICAKKDPTLFQCSPDTIQTALYNCLQFDLVAGARNEVALLPRNNKKTNKLELNFQPMVGGMIKIAYDSGLVKSIDSEVVYENDFFDYQQGSETKIIFKKELFKERGKKIGAYAVINLASGQPVIEVMRIDELEKIRKLAKTDFIWSANEDEMYRKTVIKRGIKRIPRNNKLAKIIEIDNELERPDIANKSINKTSEINKLLSQNAESETVEIPQGMQSDLVDVENFNDLMGEK